jgi:hypothetical protein
LKSRMKIPVTHLDLLYPPCTWIPACAGMTEEGACRGAKALCVTHCSPFAKGGYRGIGSGLRWSGAEPTPYSSPVSEVIRNLRTRG